MSTLVDKGEKQLFGSFFWVFLGKKVMSNDIELLENTLQKKFCSKISFRSQNNQKFTED